MMNDSNRIFLQIHLDLILSKHKKEVVYYMKQVTAAILIEKGRVLIARRPCNDVLQYKWEFPGGKIEDGETPEECLERELMEEFAIQVKVGSYFTSSVYNYEHGKIELLAYFVRREAGNLIPYSHDAIEWALPTELHGYDFAPADIPIVEKLIREARR